MSNHALGLASHILLMAIAISLVLLFLGITITVLIHVCVVGRTLRQGIFSDSNVERGGSSSMMSQHDIEKLPCFDFKANEKATSPAADCAVCLEKFSVGEKCRLLPSCNHSFHAECVDLWLLRTPICPICRGGVDFMGCGVGESGVGIAVSDIEREENGDCHRGMSQTMEVGVECSGNSFIERQIRRECISSHEVVIEVGESQEIGKSNSSHSVNEDVMLNCNESMVEKKIVVTIS